MKDSLENSIRLELTPIHPGDRWHISTQRCVCVRVISECRVRVLCKFGRIDIITMICQKKEANTHC